MRRTDWRDFLASQPSGFGFAPVSVQDRPDLDAYAANRLQGKQELQSSFIYPPKAAEKVPHFFYGSEKLLRDIASVVKLSGTELDWEYLQGWARKLVLAEVWRVVLARLGR